MDVVLWDAPVGADRNMHLQVPEFVAPALEQITLLACIIHESSGFVNKHPQQIENLCCGFRQGASHPLKASPERRPEKAVVEARRVDCP